jgi:hypothetical protein
VNIAIFLLRLRPHPGTRTGMEVRKMGMNMMGMMHMMMMCMHQMGVMMMGMMPPM